MATRRTRSVLIDGFLGKIFTDVRDSSVVDASKVIAAPTLKTYQWSPATTTTTTIVAKNIAQATGITFPQGAILASVTLTAVTAPTNSVSNSTAISITVKKGTSYETSTSVGTFSLLSGVASITYPLTSEVYGLAITLAAGNSIFVDIIKVGNVIFGKGFGFKLGYYS